MTFQINTLLAKSLEIIALQCMTKLKEIWLSTDIKCALSGGLKTAKNQSLYSEKWAR
jgi:hypothetical protein